MRNNIYYVLISFSRVNFVMSALRITSSALRITSKIFQISIIIWKGNFVKADWFAYIRSCKRFNCLCNYVSLLGIILFLIQELSNINQSFIRNCTERNYYAQSILINIFFRKDAKSKFIPTVTDYAAPTSPFCKIVSSNSE